MSVEVGKRKRTIGFYIGIAFLLAFLIVLSFIETGNYSDDFVKTAGIITLATYAVTIFLWYKTTKKIASIFFIFLLMCAMFNAGQIFLGTFDITFGGNVDIYQSYSNQLLVEMMLFQSKSVLVMGIGGCLAYNKKAYDFPGTADAGPIRHKASRGAIGTLEITYFVLYALMLFSYLREFITRSGTSYGDYYYGEREGISILLLFAYHVVLYAVFIKHNKDGFNKVLLGSNLVLGFIMLMIGSRNVVLQLLFGTLFIFLYVKRNLVKISFKKLLAIILIALVILVLFTGFQEVRQLSFSDITLETLVDIYGKSLGDSLVNALAQMGGSARCILQTMKEMKAGFASPEPTLLYAIAKGFVPIQLLSLVGLDTPENASLSAWITEAGGSQYGWGYSIFAEMYYNFQEWGWIFGFFFAFAYVKLEQKSLKLVKEGRIFYACAIIYVLAYVIFMARADMALISSRLRYCVYIAIISYLMKKFKIRFTLSR